MNFYLLIFALGVMPKPSKYSPKLQTQLLTNLYSIKTISFTTNLILKIPAFIEPKPEILRLNKRLGIGDI